MKALTLEDMTKDELAWLIRQRWPGVTQRDLLFARWHSLNDKRERIMTEAQEQMEANIGLDIDKIKRYQAASRRFDEGMNMAEQADAIWEQMMALKT